jgi:formate-dependent nitrite reductase membrane component NrfD
MNKYEKRAQAERKAVLRSSMTLGGAGIALIVVVVLIVWLNSSAPTGYVSKVVIGLALLLLAGRIVSRYFRGGTSRAAQPDPKSSLKLD